MKSATLPNWFLQMCYWSLVLVMLYFGYYALETYKVSNWGGVCIALFHFMIACWVFFSYPHIQEKTVVIEKVEMITDTQYIEKVADITVFAASPNIIPLTSLPKGLGCVYLIQDASGSGYCKIGMTFDISRRMSEHRSKSPFTTKILHIIPTDNPSMLESFLHRNFHSKRKHGEWFDLSQADVSQIQSL